MEKKIYNYKNIKENITDKIVCNWSILKSEKKYKKYSIISVVFFLRKELHDNKKIEEIDKYINGITNIINTFLLVNGFILRIYFDISVNIILQNILNNIDKKIFNKIELFQYDIPLFKYGINHHRGLIGMIIRFLPLFNIPLHKVDRCLILDIDNDIYSYFTKILNTCDKKNINFCSKFLYGYALKEYSLLYASIFSKNILEKYLTKYSIVCAFIYQNNINFLYAPYSLLSNFLNLYLKNNLNDNMYNLLNKNNLINFEYGFDEVFMNKIYFLYIYNTQKIQFAPVKMGNSNHFKVIIKIYINYIRYVNKNVNNLIILVNFLQQLAKIININIIFNIKNNNNLEKLGKYLIFIYYTDELKSMFNTLENVDNKYLNSINTLLDMEIKKNIQNISFIYFLNSCKSFLNEVKKDKICIIHMLKNNNN